MADAYETGELARTSYVSPWAVVSLLDIDIDRAVARLTGAFTDAAVAEMIQYRKQVLATVLDPDNRITGSKRG